MKIRTTATTILRRWRLPVTGLIFAALAGGCTKDQRNGAPHPGGTVEARITLSPDTFGELDVRATDENLIEDIWIVQLNSAGTAQLQAPQYITSLTASGGDYTVTAKLTAQAGKVYFIANTHEATAYSAATTSADVERAKIYPAIADNFGSTTPMSGVWTGTPGASGIPGKVSLARSVAKINFSVNSSLPAGESFSISTIYVYTPSSAYYFRDPAKSLPIPAESDFELRSTVFNGGGNKPSVSYAWLVSENARGTGTGTKESEKTAANAPSAKCSYVQVTGIYTDVNGLKTATKYDIYLGTNAINDYNVLRNTVYTVAVTIKGRDASDARISSSTPSNYQNYTDGGGQPWFIVAKADLPDKMNYQAATGESPGDTPDFNAIRPDSQSTVTRAAKGACPDGWRVPTPEELMLIYVYKQALGTFLTTSEADGGYWSTYPWAVLNMYNGKKGENTSAISNLYVRCIREI